MIETIRAKLNLPYSVIEKQKILIVDDREENLIALKTVLSPLAVDIHRATSGNEALATTLDHHFAVLILDIRMPGMDGYELAEHLRSDVKTRMIPIIFVTASHTNEQQVFKGYEAGGVDYIVKPFVPEILLGKIRVFLEIDLYRTHVENMARADIEDKKRQAEGKASLAQEQLLAQQRSENQRIQSELDRIKGELVRVTRLAAVGQVSASIAHDLRNPLGAARNACYLIKHHALDNRDKLLPWIDIIDTEIARSDQIISNLLSMARARKPERTFFHLDRLIREICDKAFQENSIQCPLDIKTTPFEVWADESQMHQVIFNIVENARHAMDPGGILTIRVVRDPSEDLIEFHDTGPGIAQEVRDTLFDPLITTKARGTGLGLTICRQIIEAHGGMIEAECPSDGGTIIRIRLHRQ